MNKRTGYFLLGTVAAFAAVVLALGLAGAPDETPAPQYTAEDVEAHFLKQREAARQAEFAREAEAARAAQAAAEAEAARQVELRRAAEAEAERQSELRQAAEQEAARQAEQQRLAQAEAERQAERARQAEADRAAAEAERQRVQAQQPVQVTETPVQETPTAEAGNSGAQVPVATDTAPEEPQPSEEVAVEAGVPPAEAPLVSQSEDGPVAPVAETVPSDEPALPVAEESPVIAASPAETETEVAETETVVDEQATPPAAPTQPAASPPTPALTQGASGSAAGGPKTVTVARSVDGTAPQSGLSRPEIPKPNTRGVTVTGRPQFPWPPPQASTVVRLPLSRFEDTLTRRTHGEIADLLERALDQGEYFDRSYWVAPGGFALATRLERITEDGEPVTTGERWPTTSLKERFDLGKYLRALFYTDPGFFRVIVFVLSTEFERTSDEEPTPKEAFRWLRRGMVMLPRDMAEQAIIEKHELTALIYEFEREAGSNAVVLAPGRLSGRTHLARAKLQQLLGAE